MSMTPALSGSVRRGYDRYRIERGCCPNRTASSMRFPLFLTDRIARMPRGAEVEGGTSAADVLR